MVTICPGYFCITIALGVIGHSERNGVEYLVEFKVITKLWIQRQVTVGIPVILETKFQLVADTAALTITQIKRIEQGRKTHGNGSLLRSIAIDEVVADDVPANGLPQVTGMMLLCGVYGNSISLPVGILDAVVTRIDFLFTKIKRNRAQLFHQFPVLDIIE